MIGYQDFLTETERSVETDWEEYFRNYLTKISKTKNINKKIQGYNTNKDSPLGIYSSISKIDSAKYDIRYLGQNIATYTEKGFELKDNLFEYFDIVPEIKDADEETVLNILNGLQPKKILRSPEHIFESCILKKMNMEENKVYFRNMQPITFSNGLFFQMPTFFSASNHKEDPRYKKNGGGIDIFARVKIKNEPVDKCNHLCIMELKDEYNRKNETPDLIIYQAIAYACCIHKLLRSSEGIKWYNFFRGNDNNKNIPENLVLYACVVTPIKKGEIIPDEYKIEDELVFENTNDKLKLRYIYIPMNDDLTDIIDEPITNLEIIENK